MTFATGSLLRLALVPEVTPGVIPATPAFIQSRVTKMGGGSRKLTSVSEEMSSDRNIRAVILEGIDVDANYDFELSYGTFDALLESALQGTFTTNVLKNGTARKYFTAEEADLSGTSAFVRYLGCIVDEFSLSLQSRKKITGSVKMMAMQEQLAALAVTGATYTAPNTNAILSSGTAVANLSLSGLTGQPKVKSLDLTVKNGLGRREQLGTLYTLEPSADPVEVTGSMLAYFESIELYNTMLSHGSGALSFQLGTTTGSKYQVDIPVCRLVNGERQRNSFKDDMMVKIDFQGEYDSTSAATIKITRAL
jgi:hypothetical protein